MTDRKPGAPGQYAAVISAAELAKLQSGEPFTITLTRDDQPITEGTPYSKATVLPDALAAVICPGVTDPSPADALAGLLPRNGKRSMTGNLPMGGNKVTGLGTPTDSADAVNKEYADQKYSPNNKPTPADIGAIPLNGQFYSDGDFDSFTTSGRFVIGGGNIKHAPGGSTSGYYNLDVIAFSGITTQIATSIWTRDVYLRRLEPNAGAWEVWAKVITNTFTGKVLWINGSATSSFPSQTISVPNLNQYSTVIVSLCSIWGGKHIQHIVNKDSPYINGPDVQALSYDNGTTHKLKRKMIVDFTNSTITFESGYVNDTVNDFKIVPIYVIGIV